jgi:hypothetical protein
MSLLGQIPGPQETRAIGVTGTSLVLGLIMRLHANGVLADADVDRIFEGVLISPDWGQGSWRAIGSRPINGMHQLRPSAANPRRTLIVPHDAVSRHRAQSTPVSLVRPGGFIAFCRLRVMYRYSGGSFPCHSQDFSRRPVPSIAKAAL